MESIVYVGMDVHNATFSLCALDGATGVILGETTCASEAKLVKKFIDHLAKTHSEQYTFQTGYEAGGLGYSLYRELTKLNIDCVILAPSTMFKADKNKRVKNDRLDARMIAQNLAGNTYHAVYVSDVEDEDNREFLRQRQEVKKSLKAKKQALGALLNQKGFHYPSDETKWTKKHIEWIKALPVTPIIRTVIDEKLIRIANDEADIARYDASIELMSHSERYEKSVQELRCFKGIDTSSAMTIHVEIADFSRFPSAPQFMSYVGLTPSEHSSGKSTNKGGLTKQGNAVVRTTLIECARNLVRGKVGYKTKSVTVRQKGQTAPIINYADKAVTRLQRKYQRMVAAGKPNNQVITAVARELAGFIWGMENHQINF